MSDVRTLDFRTELNSPAEIRKTEHVLIYSTVLRDRFRVLVTKDGTPASLTGQTIAGYVLRPDGATVVSGFTVEKETDGTGYAAIVLPAEAYAVPGNVIISIFASDSSAHILPLLAVRARVAKTTSDTVVDPGDSLPSVAELEALIAEAASTVTSLGPRVEAVESTTSTHTTQIATLSGQIGLINDNLAPTFSTSNAYAAGSYVLKDMVLYRFKVDHAAGAWNASEVEAVSLGGDLSAETAQVDFLMGDQPTFEVSGETVSFYPAPGAKYKAVTSFLPVQDGTPTVDNPVTITGTSELGLSITVGSGTATEHEVEFDSAVLGGEYDWGTGKVKPGFGTLVLDGSSDENWNINTSQGMTVRGDCLADLPSVADAKRSLFYCNRLRNYSVVGNQTGEILLRVYPTTSKVIRLQGFSDVTGITSDTEARAWVAAHPLTIVYPMKEADRTETAAGTPVTLTGTAAKHTLEADGGTVTASGYTSLKDFPPAPTTAGTYTLKATATASGVTYAWVAEAATLTSLSIGNPMSAAPAAVGDNDATDPGEPDTSGEDTPE